MCRQKVNAEFIKARICDATVIGILRQKIWSTTYRGIYPDEIIDNFDFRLHLERDQSKIIDPFFHVYLIRFNGIDIGYFIFQIRYTEIWLHSLYVLHEYQHCGIGKQAFTLLRDICKEKGTEYFSCSCNPNNSNAMDFYRHMGGTITQIDTGHQNKQEDEVVFEFLLQNKFIF